MKFPKTEEMVARYYELCDQRDKLYKAAQPYEDELTQVNSQIETLRAKQQELSEKIDDTLGRENFLAIKKEIGQIASFLRSIPPRS